MRLEQLGAPRRTHRAWRRTTPDEVRQIVDLAKRGLPGKQIAAVMGHQMSRDSVYKIAHRRGVSLRRARAMSQRA